MPIMMIAGLLLLSDPATQPPAPATPAAKPAKAKEAKVCKADPDYTGTRMSKRICLTQSEWDVREQDVSVGDLKAMGAH